MTEASIHNLAARFERVCTQILIAHRIEEIARVGLHRPDFLGKNLDTGELILAEYKLYLSKQPRPTLFYQGISSLLRYKPQFPQARLLLVVSVPLQESWKNIAKEAGVGEVWDLGMLIEKAAVDHDLSRQLIQTLTDAGVGDLGTLGVSMPPAAPDTEFNRPRSITGAQLCDFLKSVKAGKPGWKDFENICKQALLFLFRDQFGDWSEQSTTDDELHRRDFIARLRPRSDFWVGLAHDFRSRYIVFEFNNYAEPISQDQVVSTEKYLFTTALRSIAIIIARNGADRGAFQAVTGALRESGKLILIISLDDLCAMLHSQDKGNDPEVLMYVRLDELLTKLGRI